MVSLVRKLKQLFLLPSLGFVITCKEMGSFLKTTTLAETSQIKHPLLVPRFTFWLHSTFQLPANAGLGR